MVPEGTEPESTELPEEQEEEIGRFERLINNMVFSNTIGGINKLPSEEEEDES